MGIGISGSKKTNYLAQVPNLFPDMGVVWRMEPIGIGVPFVCSFHECSEARLPVNGSSTWFCLQTRARNVRPCCSSEEFVLTILRPNVLWGLRGPGAFGGDWTGAG